MFSMLMQNQHRVAVQRKCVFNECVGRNLRSSAEQQITNACKIAADRCHSTPARCHAAQNCICMAAFTYQETFIFVKATGEVKYIDEAIDRAADELTLTQLHLHWQGRHCLHQEIGQSIWIAVSAPWACQHADLEHSPAHCGYADSPA